MVQFADVSNASTKVRIMVRFSKIDQTGRSVTLIFVSSSDKRICPVTLLSSYARQRPKMCGTFFCHFNGLPVTRFQFAAVLNKAKSFFGIKQVVRPYSFRIRATTHLCQKNVGDNDIMVMGRWAVNSQA